MTLSIEARMDRLESYIEIVELRSQYGWHAARGDVRGIASLFTEDCEFITSANAEGVRRTIHGRQQIIDDLEPILGKPGTVIPLVVNHVVRISGDEGTGTCAMQSVVSPLPGAPAMVTYYYDKFRRVEGRWCFAARKHSQYRPMLQLDDTRGVFGI